MKTYHLALKKISIIGCGWLGSALANRLISSDFDVVGSTTSIGKLESLRKAGITPLVYTLGMPVPLPIMNSEVVIINIPPRGNYLQELEKFCSALNSETWVIFASSSSVYKNTNIEVHENDAIDYPSPHTGISLLKAENIFFESPLDTTIVRFAGLFGPNRHPGNFLANKENIAGANNPVNMIHLDDCVAIIHKIMDLNSRNEVFNACATAHPTKELFYTQASKLLNLQPPKFNDQDSPFKIINSHKLESALKYKFIHPDPIKALESI